MAYITTEYYRNIYHGEAPEDELPALIERAEDVIRGMFFHEPDISKLSERQTELLQKAVAVQVDYIDELGGVSAAGSGGFTQASLGKFSYSGSSSVRDNGLNICPLSVSLLERACLLGRGLAP